MDLHISVIADFKHMFPEFDIVDWCMSGHSWVFGRKQDIPTIINPRTWCELDSTQITAFQEKYDSFLKTFDGFICGHPNSFALIFEKYNKPIILINSCRYDLPFCWSKNFAMRKALHDCLQRLDASGRLIAVSNNKADQLYLRTATNIATTHIPSLCAYTGARWSPSRPTFLCYSGSLPSHPLITPRSALPRPFKWSDLATFKGIIHFPYEISTMSMFEHFTAGIPMFFPSRTYMLREVDIQSVSAYWKDSLPPDLAMFADKKLWIDLADFYQVFNCSPNVRYFDSTPHLFELLATFEWQDDREILDEYRRSIRANWMRLLVPHFLALESAAASS